LHGRGRKRKTSRRDDRRIIQEAKKFKKITAREIKENAGLDVSVSTIRRRLNESGLWGRVARRKPLICSRNMAKRLEFAKQYVNESQCRMSQSLKRADQKEEKQFGSAKDKHLIRMPFSQQ